jgi:hypothetical protein
MFKRVFFFVIFSILIMIVRSSSSEEFEDLMNELRAEENNDGNDKRDKPDPFPEHVEDMLAELEKINLDDFDMEKIEEEMRRLGGEEL